MRGAVEEICLSRDITAEGHGSGNWLDGMGGLA